MRKYNVPELKISKSDDKTFLADGKGNSVQVVPVNAHFIPDLGRTPISDILIYCDGNRLVVFPNEEGNIWEQIIQKRAVKDSSYKAECFYMADREKFDKAFDKYKPSASSYSKIHFDKTSPCYSGKLEQPKVLKEACNTDIQTLSDAFSKIFSGISARGKQVEAQMHVVPVRPSIGCRF